MRRDHSRGQRTRHGREVLPVNWESRIMLVADYTSQRITRAKPIDPESLRPHRLYEARVYAGKPGALGDTGRVYGAIDNGINKGAVKDIASSLKRTGRDLYLVLREAAVTADNARALHQEFSENRARYSRTRRDEREPANAGATY